MSPPGGRKHWRRALSLCAAVACVFGALYLARPRSAPALRPLIDLRYPGTRWVDPATLAQWLAREPAARPQLLDVREPDEFAVSHLRGARRVAPDLADVSTLQLEPGATVVVYCAVGVRSAALFARLRAGGVRNVYNLLGGLFEWANQGRPLYRGATRAYGAHPYDRLWGTLLRPELRRAR
jgi:rhodanese-related sulfurtransferase